MKHSILLPFLTLPAACLAQTIDFDFQGSGSPADAPPPYNVITLGYAVSGTLTFTGLKDTDGDGAYSVAVTTDGGVAGVTGSGPDDGSFDSAAYGDGFRTNNEADGQMTITFGGLDSGLLYELKLFTDSNLSFTGSVDYRIGTINQLAVDSTVPSSFTLSGLQPSGGELVLVIQANGLAGSNELTRGGALNAARLTVTGAPDPDIPTELSATVLSDTSVQLDWIDNSSIETGFRIERKSGGGSYSEIASLPANTTTFTDTGLTASTTCTYRVRADLGGGSFSGYSEEASATTLDAPPVAPDGDPSGLTATALFSNTIRIDWLDNSSNEDGFAIERQTGGVWSAITTVPADTTSYTDTGLSPETTYNYRVRAYNTAGFSGYSGIATATTGALGSGPLNVLMIVIDDMSAAAIGHPAYGRTHPSIQSPALDRLCDEGLAFTQAYSNWPACMPARQMFMGGKDVEISQWRYTGSIRNNDGMNRSLVYMHQHFQENGYSTVRLDKVFHIGSDVPEGWDITEEPFGENRDRTVTQSSELGALGLDDNVDRFASFSDHPGETSLIYEMAETDENGDPIDANRLTDGITKLRALEILDDFSTPGGRFDANQKPFFMAVGFRRPHLPFVAPKEYYGRFKWGTGDTTVNDPGIPEIVLPPFNSAATDENNYRQSLEGYYACTAMTNDHIMELLDKLDASGLANNTVVVVFGDNGYGLGEHNKFFSKGTPDNVSFHVPMIFRIPGGNRVNDTEAKAVTLLDIYPTLVDLCGLPDPGTPLDGKSLAPLLEKHEPNWVEEAYAIMDGSSDPADPLGHLVWAGGMKYYENNSGNPSELYAVGDGDRFEWTNLINNSAYNDIEAELKARSDSLRARSAARVPPALVQHAPTQVVAAGEDALFSFRDEGDEVLAVQWSKDGVDLAGETATSLLIQAVAGTDEGEYQAKAVNRSGRTLTYRAALKVIDTAGTLFDWQVDQIEAPFIIDGINGAHFQEIVSIAGTFGPNAVTSFATSSNGFVRVAPGLPYGSYRISQWNPNYSSSTSEANYTVRHTGGDTPVVVDQTTSTGAWVEVGTYPMSPESDVLILAQTSVASKRTAVDGMRFERLTAPANNKPVALDDGTHLTAPDTPVVIDILANDSDADGGDSLELLQLSGGRYGVVTYSADQVTYTPRPGVTNATETIRYQLTDGKDRSNPASFTVTVAQQAGTSAVALDTNGGGSAGSDAGTVVSNGTIVNLTATAYPGYLFYYWEGPEPSMENPLVIAPTGNITYQAVFRPVPEIDTYAEWAALRNWTGPGDDDPLANPDGDPHINLLEYGLDLDATRTDNPPFLIEPDPVTGEWIFRFRRSLNAPESAVTVWTSPDLSPDSWTEYLGDVFVTDFDPDGDFSAQEREIRLSPGAPPTFVRLEVTD
ncbi:MAG: sulfatase-like hydrolase/transferase [Oceanipulchritudo sp.]